MATRRGSNTSEKARLRQQVSKSIQKKQKNKVLLFKMLIIYEMLIMYVQCTYYMLLIFFSIV